MAQTRLVPANLEGPVDRVVRSLFGTSWGKARGWIEGGKVRVGGALVTDPTARVAAGAEIALNEAARKPQAEELADGDVAYADAQVVVVRKPPGLSTIPYDGTEVDTLDARVRAWLERKRLTPRGQRPTLGIVHRLDKETSGLVVFTRTWLAKQALSSQFRHHTVYRRYLAVAHGDVPERTLRSFFIENRGDGLRGSKRGPGRKPPTGAFRRLHEPVRRRVPARRARACHQRENRKAARAMRYTSEPESLRCARSHGYRPRSMSLPRISEVTSKYVRVSSTTLAGASPASIRFTTPL